MPERSLEPRTYRMTLSHEDAKLILRGMRTIVGEDLVVDDRDRKAIERMEKRAIRAALSTEPKR